METETLTPAALAARLNGSEYDRKWPPKDVMAEAKAAGLVVVYGASEDLMEFEGAIYDEIGAWEGTTARIDAEGLVLKPDTDYFSDEDEEIAAVARYAARKAGAAKIKAIWDAEGYSWVYETTLPHATFDVVEGEDKYCRGIVFRLADLPSVATTGSAP